MPFRCAVVEHHIASVSFIEFKGSQIYPCAATHLLINYKFACSSHVMNSVTCCRSAGGQTLIRYVYSIFSSFRYLRTPFYRSIRVCFRSDTCRLSDCAHCKRIVYTFVHRLYIGKSDSCITPFSHLFIGGNTSPSGSSVIVRNDFILLNVTFAWQHHICSCIFKHRNKVGEYESLREHILACLEQAGTLPLPFPGCRVVISAVTLPKGDVSSTQSFLEHRSACPADDR